jgi:DNA-binding helix-hairpin-helix protein with protein kinase domain
VTDRVRAIDGLKAEAEKSYQSLLGLPSRYGEEFRKLDGKRRESQLEEYMDRFLITRQKIKNLGPKRITILQAAGIETAWDVRGRFQPPRIPEGVWDDLQDWSRSKERLFKFDATEAIPAQDLMALNLRFGHEKANLQSRMRQFHGQIDQASREAAQSIASMMQQIQENMQLLKQAEADWQVVEK